MTPEAVVTEKTEAQLGADGWPIRDFKAVDFSVGRYIRVLTPTWDRICPTLCAIFRT